MMRKLGRGGRVAAWSVAGVLGAGAVAGVVVSQAGAAAATSAGSAASVRDTSATPAPWPGPGLQVRAPAAFRAGMVGPAGMLAGPGALPGRLGAPLYGTWTFRQGGTDHTYRMQVGTLTATGGSAFTVTSSDHTTYSYTADAGTKLMKNGSASTLAALNGATVRVLAEQSGGGYVARAVVSGMPPRVAVRVAVGVLQVAADGKSVTVNGQMFLVDSSTRVIKNGTPTPLADLKGAKVRVVGVENSSGSMVARLVISGPHPGVGLRTQRAHFWLGPKWIGMNASQSASSASA